MSRIAFLAVTILALATVRPVPAASPGGGGGGSGGGTGPTPPPRHSVRDPGALPQRGDSPGFQVGGRVLSEAGQPLAGIVIKMFANGRIISSATSDAEGGFEIEGGPELGGNNTTTLWFEGQGDDLVATSLILALGDVAEQKSLYPECTPRVEVLGDAARVEVILRTPDQRNAFVSQSGCLGSSGS